MKRNKVGNRLMLMGLICSLSLSAIPCDASGMEADGEKQTEVHTEAITQTETEGLTENVIPSKGDSQSDSEIQLEPTGQTEEMTSTIDTETNEQPAETEEEKGTEDLLYIEDREGRTIKAVDVGGMYLEGENIQEGIDYTYDEEGKVLTVLSDKNMLIFSNDSMISGGIVIQAKEANIHLANLALESNAGSVLKVSEGSKLTLTVFGENRLTALQNDTSAAVLEKNAQLLIEGEGRLSFEGKGEKKSISMNRGDEENDIPSILCLRDGTVEAVSGIEVLGTAEEKKAQISVVGGSFHTSGLERKDFDVLGVGEKKDVYQTVISFSNENSHITNLTVKVEGKDYSYGNTGIHTDSKKQIYLFLPAGKAEIVTSTEAYAGVVTLNDKTQLTKTHTGAEIQVHITDMTSITYGTAQNGAAAVEIKNTSPVGTTLNAELTGEQSDCFALSGDSAEIPGGSTAAPSVNKELTIKPAEELLPGTYSVILKLTDLEGAKTEAKVQFTVNKAVLTPIVKIDEKKYDGSTKAVGTVTLTGKKGSDEPKLKAGLTFVFNNPNVKKASYVTVSNIALDDDSAKKYQLNNSTGVLQVKASIKKAVNKHKIQKPQKPKIKAIYDSKTNVWSLEMTTCAGQEYLFFGEQDKKIVNLTRSNLNSNNWQLNEKKTIKNRKLNLKVKEGLTYTIWTRFAGDNNHEPGVALAHSSITVKKPAKTYKSSENMVTGLTEGTTYKTNSILAFQAVGAGMDNASPNEGDERFLPISWKISESHDWSIPPYEASFKMPTAGSYQLQVTFQKQSFQEDKWINQQETGTSKINFNIASTGLNGTSSPVLTSSNTGGLLKASNPTATVVKAAKTSDTTPILPTVMSLLGSGILLVLYDYKRKKRLKNCNK